MRREIILAQLGEMARAAGGTAPVRQNRRQIRAPYGRSSRKDRRTEVVETVALSQQASALEEQREVVVLPDARF